MREAVELPLAGTAHAVRSGLLAQRGITALERRGGRCNTSSGGTGAKTVLRMVGLSSVCRTLYHVQGIPVEERHPKRRLILGADCFEEPDLSKLRRDR